MTTRPRANERAKQGSTPPVVEASTREDPASGDDAPRMVMGLQPVREAIRAHGAAIARVVLLDRGGPRVSALGRYARDQHIEVTERPRSHLDKLTRGGQHQGAVAFAPPLALHDPESFELPPDALLVMLDGITDPQNFGAVIRCAVAFGATGVIWGEHHAAPLSPATFRASAGAVEHARLFQAPSLKSTVAGLRDRGAAVIALDAAADEPLSALDLTGPVVLVVGAEDRGVSRGVRRACTAVGRLPMPGPIGSLNASVAAAVAIYEILRQRSAG